jgi:hypothetical protein
MRVLAAGLFVVSLLLAGCSGGEGGGGTASSTTTTTATTTTTGALSTSTGLPVVAVSGPADISLTLAADSKVQRVRLVAFKDFTLDEVVIPGSDGGGGGGGGGQNNAPPKDFGIAIFPADTTPVQQASCKDAADFHAWDGRTDATNPDWDINAGVYDLWAWSSTSTYLTLTADDGGKAQNVTMKSFNWTAAVSAPTVTKSGPAQTTASFEEAIDSTQAALILGEFTPPQGYPDGTSSLAITFGGAECVKVTSAGGGGGGFGPFGATTLRAHAFVGKGAAALSGDYSATVSPTGEPAVALVVLKPA